MIAHSLCSRCTATNSSVSRAQLTFGKAVSSTGIATKPTTKVAARASFEVIAGKMKTRKSAAKRYKVTASGKVSSARVSSARYFNHDADTLTPHGFLPITLAVSRRERALKRRKRPKK
mmetsp:Transcript_2929/g.10623  ORF Transcript_2929/g.10623 Transcript_2929/m.10623 type:complete len:118 (-) Transcript_2929:563-916(-)